jgi:hypothetical protein
MRVWRIENRESRLGMYSGVGASPLDEGASSRHPTPLGDSLLCKSIANSCKTCNVLLHLTKHKEYRYGFSSLEQLRSWVYKDEWLSFYHNRNFALVEYDADIAYQGNTQCVFIPTEQRLEYDIAEFFNLPLKGQQMNMPEKESIIQEVLQLFDTAIAVCESDMTPA